MPFNTLSLSFMAMFVNETREATAARAGISGRQYAFICTGQRQPGTALAIRLYELCQLAQIPVPSGLPEPIHWLRDAVAVADADRLRKKMIGSTTRALKEGTLPPFALLWMRSIVYMRLARLQGLSNSPQDLKNSAKDADRMLADAPDDFWKAVAMNNALCAEHGIVKHVENGGKNPGKESLACFHQRFREVAQTIKNPISFWNCLDFSTLMEDRSAVKEDYDDFMAAARKKRPSDVKKVLRALEGYPFLKRVVGEPLD